MHVVVHGAKNAALPALFVAAAARSKVVIENIPTSLLDVSSVVHHFALAGAKFDSLSDNAVSVDSSKFDVRAVEPEFYPLTRYSLLSLALAYVQDVELAVRHPGGCNLRRGHDIHLDLYRSLGCDVVDDGQTILFRPRQAGPQGSDFNFRLPSVGASLSLLISGLRSTTLRARNCAVEPEVRFISDMCVQLGGQAFLGSDGIEPVQGAGLNGARCVGVTRCIPDRVAAITLVVAAILGARQSVTLANFPFEFCSSELSLIEAHMAHASFERVGSSLVVRSSVQARSKGDVRLTATQYPGVSSDSVPSLVVLFALLGANVSIHDQIYTDRFGYLAQLARFGFVSTNSGDQRVVSWARSATRPAKGEIRVDDLRGAMAAAMVATYLGCAEAIHDFTRLQISRGYEMPERILGLIEGSGRV